MDVSTDNSGLLCEERYSASYWLKWIKAAKKAAKDHFESSRAAWDEYLSINSDPVDVNKITKTKKARYPAYYNHCMLIEPKFYSRTPLLRIKRRFGIKDQIANTGSIILQRLGEDLIETEEFDEAVSASVQDFIHSNKMSLQVIYEADIKKVETEEPEEELEEGEEEQSEVAEGYEEESGEVEEEPEEEISNQKIYLAPLPFDEVLHTPKAKSNAEIKEKAIYFCLDYHDAIDKFCKDKNGIIDQVKVNNLMPAFKVVKDEDNQESEGSKFLEGWECYSLHTMKVYWLAENFHSFLKPPEEDIYEFPNLFPCTPFIFGTKPRKNLYPTPVHAQLKTTIEMMHRMYGRLLRLIDNIRRRAIADGSNPDVVAAFRDLDDQEIVFVQNLSSIVEKGGTLDGLLLYVPVAPLVEAIKEMTALVQQFEENFNKWAGSTEIMQGAIQNVNLTLGEQEMMSGAIDDRFKNQRKKIQFAIREGIKLMIDLALKVYSDEKIKECIGFEYLEDIDKQNFPEALAFLRKDKQRNLRIDIETDSTSFSNDQLISKQRTEVVNTLLAGIEKLNALIAQKAPPAYVSTALKALLLTMDGIPGGSKFQDEITQIVNELSQAAKAPVTTPPPVDYEQLKIQLQQAQLQLKANELQLKASDQNSKNQLKLREIDSNTQLKVQSQQVNAQSESMQMQLDSLLTNLKQREQLFNEQLAQAYLQLDQFKAQMSANESMAEEERLAFDSQTNMITAQKPEPIPQPATPPATIIINNKSEPPQPEVPLLFGL